MEYIGDKVVIYKKKLLGVGAFGFVFKGIYNSQIPCAVKMPHSMGFDIQYAYPTMKLVNAKALKKFESECAFLQSFEHPYVVKHIATEIHPNCNLPILVIELMDASLHEYYTSKPTCNSCQEFHGSSQSTVISFSFSIACALQYLHSRAVVHRDLCGNNVLLQHTEKCSMPIAKISDFGISRLIDSEKLSKSLSTLFDRKAYLPPEAARLDQVTYDSSLDIFSFGTTMLQIANQLPTIDSIQSREQELAKLADEHPLKQIIIECLKENKNDRPSAAKLIAEINSIPHSQ